MPKNRASDIIDPKSIVTVYVVMTSPSAPEREREKKKGIIIYVRTFSECKIKNFIIGTIYIASEVRSFNIYCSP